MNPNYVMITAIALAGLLAIFAIYESYLCDRAIVELAIEYAKADQGTRFRIAELTVEKSEQALQLSGLHKELENLWLKFDHAIAGRDAAVTQLQDRDDQRHRMLNDLDARVTEISVVMAGKIDGVHIRLGEAIARGKNRNELVDQELEGIKHEVTQLKDAGVVELNLKAMIDERYADLTRKIVQTNDRIVAANSEEGNSASVAFGMIKKKIDSEAAKLADLFKRQEVFDQKVAAVDSFSHKVQEQSIGVAIAMEQVIGDVQKMRVTLVSFSAFVVATNEKITRHDEALYGGGVPRYESVIDNLAGRDEDPEGPLPKFTAEDWDEKDRSDVTG